MNFLGMGPAELMLILVIALIVFGPGKLPEVAGQVGKAVRDIRRATTDLSSEFNRTLSLELEEKRESEAAAPAPPPPPVVEASNPSPAVAAGPATTVSGPSASTVPPAVSAATESHWEEPWKPDAPASAPASGATPLGELSNPYMIFPAGSRPVEPATSNGEAAVARRDLAEIAPPY